MSRQILTRNQKNVTKASSNNENSTHSSNDNISTLEGIKKEFNKQIALIQKNFAEQLKDISDVFQNNIDELIGKVSSLEIEVVQLKNEVQRMKKEKNTTEKRLDDVEQHMNNNIIILSGKEVISSIRSAPSSLNYAGRRALWAANDVIQKKLNVSDEDYRILAARRLGRPPKNQNVDERPIAVTIDDYISKKTIFSAVLSLKSKGIFINEFLTKKRLVVLKSLLEARKRSERKYLQIFTIDGVIHFKTTKEGKSERIQNEKDVESVMNYLSD